MIEEEERGESEKARGGNENRGGEGANMNERRKGEDARGIK